MEATWRNIEQSFFGTRGIHNEHKA